MGMTGRGRENVHRAQDGAELKMFLEIGAGREEARFYLIRGSSR
jgi:hypothetical protein